MRISYWSSYVCSSDLLIEETAGVDEHHVGAGIVGRQAVAVGTQFGQDAFAVDQRLGAAERHHDDFWLGGEGFDCHDRRRLYPILSGLYSAARGSIRGAGRGRGRTREGARRGGREGGSMGRERGG